MRNVLSSTLENLIFIECNKETNHQIGACLFMDLDEQQKQSKIINEFMASVL